MALISSACVEPISFINLLFLPMLFVKGFIIVVKNEICFKTHVNYFFSFALSSFFFFLYKTLVSHFHVVGL